MDNAGNFLDSSTSLDATQEWQAIEEKVGLNSTDDYYSVQLNSRSYFEVVLNDLSDNADISLLNNNGSKIASSSHSGTRNERIARVLDAGTYFIKVHQVDDAEISYGFEYRSNHLPEKFQFDVKSFQDDISLTDTKIFDADGASNISKVDFWLKKEGERWRKAGIITEFKDKIDQITGEASIGFDYNIDNLEAGKYYLWGRATDNFGFRSNGWGKIFEVKNFVDPKVENVAPSRLDFTIDSSNGGIELNDAKVYDANGIDDLEKVAFQLKKQGGEWIDIDDVIDFKQVDNNLYGFDYSISSLEAGNYELKATAYDKAGNKSESLKSFFRINNLAPSDLAFEVEVVEDGIRLTDTKLFDANGINDLSRVDFWLKKEGGNWQNIEDAVEFRSNQDEYGSIGFDYSIDSLEKGNYTLWARVRDKDNKYSNSKQETFTIGNAAPVQLDFNFREISGGIELRNARVFDADGINDLEKIDFQLKKEGGEWIDIEDAVEFSENKDGSIGFGYSINGLKQGNYQLKATAIDKAGETSEALTTYFKVKNAAPTDLLFDIKTIDGGISLENTQVYDANGIDDITRVDFWLKKDDEGWQNIDDALDFRRNEDDSFSFDYSLNSLESGDYVLWARSRDKADSYGNVWQKSFSIENVAPSQLDFDIQTSKGRIELTNVSVFDANGIDDIDKVKVWWQKDDGVEGGFADISQFRKNADGTFSFDYNTDSLQNGNYKLFARINDKANEYIELEKSFQITGVVPPQPEKDWFDRNISDAEIRNQARKLFSDKTLNRNDMIAILEDGKDNNIVDATEIKDFRTILSNASYLGIDDYVRVLANKVVNGDTANKSGNLQAGSSSEQLDKLINKWFRGSERPQTPHTYQYAKGSLFQNGISHDDIRQGYINNCFFLAGLGATLVQSPEIIQNMFIDNGDGTFTVRFYKNGVADYVTVDRYLPTNNIGNLVYANAGDYHGNDSNELWVALAEKAYAQLNEAKWINQDGTNSYNGIGNAGYLSDAFKHITGEKAALGRFLSFNKVVNAFQSGEVVGFGSKSGGVASNIVTSHAYALVDYNAQTQKFTLLNPWSTDNNALKSRTLELSWNEIISNFSYWDSTISNVVST
ncbi:MAG: pre-peptidase C-terminal domain-containing protein [Rivularia sp. (in: Bacteria)]|nr:pre-peptidase C-terminal domain-containing protein [Rivularia sp. MS3]